MKDDGVSLKDEMIMVVNSLRSDVLHANEYIRGRTMRLLSRIQYKGILESLIPSVIDNLKHSHYFVRRNAL
jgi:coatomer subunit beta